LKRDLKRSVIPERPLFKETRYSDGAIVTIIQCDPVDESGNPDETGTVEFRGETLARIGLPKPIPITFRIPDVKTLQEARSMYGKYLDLAAQETVRMMQAEMLEAQKAAQQQIVVPGAGGQLPPGLMSAIQPKQK